LQATEALGIIQTSSPFERALARLLLATYNRCLRRIIKAAPVWAGEDILGASGRIMDWRAGLWMSEN